MALFRLGRTLSAPDQQPLSSGDVSPTSPRFGARVLGSRRLRLWVPIAATLLLVFIVAQQHQENVLPHIQTAWEKTKGKVTGQTGGNDPLQELGAAAEAEESTPATTAQVPEVAAAPIDWSRFAYTQYVTDGEYLCNSVMLFEILHRLNSRADRVLMYPADMVDPHAENSPEMRPDARLVLKARDEYKVKLVPIQVQKREVDDPTWGESFTKLLAFNQTAYTRVLNLDSDSIVLQPMDELFLLPPCPVAMPRAYWLYPEKEILSSQLMLVQPSAAEFARVLKKINNAGPNDYDMEIVNDLYRDSALVLPHRPYDLLTAEFRREEHHLYLGSKDEVWDPVAVYNEAKFLHFSDWPVPKPWLHASEDVRREYEPKCKKKGTDGGTEKSCVERDLWNGFYKDFVERRLRVCGWEQSSAHRRRRERRSRGEYQT